MRETTMPIQYPYAVLDGRVLRAPEKSARRDYVQFPLNADYRCAEPTCNQPMIYRHGTKQVPHFRHKASNINHPGEGASHRWAKQWLQHQLEAAGYKVELEKTWNRDRRVDISVSGRDNKNENENEKQEALISIEFQHSPIEFEIVKKRMKIDQANGYRGVLWIFDLKRFLIRQNNSLPLITDKHRADSGAELWVPNEIAKMINALGRHIPLHFIDVSEQQLWQLQVGTRLHHPFNSDIPPDGPKSFLMRAFPITINQFVLFNANSWTTRKPATSIAAVESRAYDSGICTGTIYPWYPYL